LSASARKSKLVAANKKSKGRLGCCVHSGSGVVVPGSHLRSWKRNGGSPLHWIVSQN
jgi:hypothetical protein